MNKMNYPLVSIITVTFNSAKFVKETLESVKSQTYKNIDLIITDDGSTDDTVEICTDWLKDNARNFTNVQLSTSAHNSGIPANCNRGLRLVKGEWVKVIAGDDLLLPNCISDNIEFANKYDTQFIVSDVIMINGKGEKIEMKNVNEGLRYFVNIKSAKKQLKSYSRWPAFINSPTFFCKSDIIDHINYCDEEFRIYEDMILILRITEIGIRVFYMDKPTVVYRLHKNAVSRSKSMEIEREKEAQRIFRKYRAKHLSYFNPIDLSVYYESWLRFNYKGFLGIRGVSLLRKMSLFYWYLRIKGIKSY